METVCKYRWECILNNVRPGLYCRPECTLRPKLAFFAGIAAEAKILRDNK